jgi:uncharacterized MnhB-related membrane protein
MPSNNNKLLYYLIVTLLILLGLAWISQPRVQHALLRNGLINPFVNPRLPMEKE